MHNRANRRITPNLRIAPTEPPSLPEVDGGVFGLPEALALVRRHLKFIGATVVGGTVLAAIVAHSLSEIYTASSTLVFERNDTRLSEAATELEGTELDVAAVETEIAVIKSRRFVGRVVDSLGLLNDPFFNSDLRTEPTPPTVNEATPSDSTSTWAAIRTWLTDFAGDAEATDRPMPPLSVQRERAISTFVSNLKISRSGVSLAISIQMAHKDAERAAILANAVGDSYVEQSLKRKKDAIDNALVLLRDRVAQLAAHIAETERKIADHIRDNELDVSRRDSSRDDLLRAEIARLKARLQLSETQSPDGETWIGPAQVEQIKTKLVTMEQELQKRTVADIRHRALEQELVTDRSRYNRLVEQLIKLESQADLQSASARVVSPAEIPFKPSYPRRKLIVVGGFVGSTMLALILALMFEGLTTRIRSAQSTMRICKLPNLAYVPETPRKRWGKPPPPYSYIKEWPLSFYAEAVRSLVVACRRSSVDDGPQVIMLTSALPHEGKSTLAVSLAVSAASLGYQTILVDLDLHRRGSSKMLGASERDGRLGSYLDGRCELRDAIQSDPEVPGMHFIAANHGSQLPGKLLGHEQLSRMIEELKAQYDIIIVDTPAALVVNDASVVGPLADAAILVARWGQTTERALQDATERLRMNGIPLIGTVINGVDPRVHARSGYGGAVSYYQQAQKYYSN